jgi:hypothetical protein
VYIKMADVPETELRKYSRQKLSSLKSQCHYTRNKYPEAAFVVQQVYKVLSDFEILARLTPAKVGESSEWTTIVNSAEKNRVNFCTVLDGRSLLALPRACI